MQEFNYPRTITQYAEYPENDISWSNNQVDTTIVDNPNYNLANPDTGAGSKNVIQTVKNLMHVPNPTRGPKLDRTFFLKCTDFGIGALDAVQDITGITLTIDANRHGRIVDDTICLVYRDQVISENKTNLSSIYGEGHLTNNPKQTYGGENDLWGAELTQDMVQDPSFGVLIRFASNPIYPHRDTAEIYKILLTIHPYNVFVLNPDATIEFISEEDGAVLVPE